MATFRVLGGLELRTGTGGESVDVIRRQKCLALLTYLVLEGPRVFVRRDKLAALLWPDLDQRHARAALRKSLHFLRAALGRKAVSSRGSEAVAVDPEELDCDVAAFRRALEEGRPDDALHLYRGDLLDGFVLSGCHDFDLWLHLRRVELREAAADAAWTLAFDRLARGAVTDGERWAQRAVELACTDEARVQEFMAALDAAGDRAAAVRFYARFERLLFDELELTPAAETRAELDRIRGRESMGSFRGVAVGSPVADTGRAARRPPLRSRCPG